MSKPCYFSWVDRLEQAGDLKLSSAKEFHSAGVKHRRLKACRPLRNSAFSSSWTFFWRWMRLSPSNPALTTKIFKWVSWPPRECKWLSSMISIREPDDGSLNSWVKAFRIRFALDVADDITFYSEQTSDSYQEMPLQFCLGWWRRQFPCRTLGVQ